MTNDDPIFSLQEFTSVLMPENDWTYDFARSQATHIFTHAGWELDSLHTEVDLIRAAIEYWGVRPVPEDQQGPVFV